jgi:MYXO-CTERM domain-containing protein
VFDKNVVLGLFPYGPAAGIGTDGTNEIDIEYSFWGQPNGTNGDFTDYPASGNTIGELSFSFSLNGSTFSTSRFIWTQNSIQDFLLSGFQTIGSTTGLIKTWTYAPNNPTVNIPQQALPLGINLWCFDAPPSDGKDVEVVIRDFEFAPEGSATGGSAGTGGSPGTGGVPGTGGTTSTGGRSATGGMPSTGGGANTGGAASTGGTISTGITNTGGIVSTGGSNATGGARSTGGGNATGGTMSTGGGSSTGGTTSTGGFMNPGETSATGGMVSATSSATAIGGASGASTVAGTSSTGGLIGPAGTSSIATAGASTTGVAGSSETVGSCSCRVAKQPSNLTPFAGFGLLGLLLMNALRRKRGP